MWVPFIFLTRILMKCRFQIRIPAGNFALLIRIMNFKCENLNGLIYLSLQILKYVVKVLLLSVILTTFILSRIFWVKKLLVAVGIRTQAAHSAFICCELSTTYCAFYGLEMPLNIVYFLYIMRNKSFMRWKCAKYPKVKQGKFIKVWDSVKFCSLRMRNDTDLVMRQ